MDASITKLEEEKSTLKDFHRRCSNTNLKTIRLMSRTKILPPIEERQGQTNKVCQICFKGKIIRTAIPKLSDSKTQERDKLIYSDLCGPIRTQSIQGNLYIGSYLDDKTGWKHLRFLCKRSQQSKEFKVYQMAFECRRGIKIKCLRIDDGHGYASRKSQDYLKEEGIR